MTKIKSKEKINHRDCRCRDDPERSRTTSNHLNERECENMSKSEQKKETKVCIEGPIR